MWADAQRDGHPAEYRWSPLFNVAVWLTTTTRMLGSNAAKTRNPSEICCTRLAENTGRKNDAKNRHLGTIPHLSRAISSQLRHVSTIGKKTC